MSQHKCQVTTIRLLINKANSILACCPNNRSYIMAIVFLLFTKEQNNQWHPEICYSYRVW